MTFRGFFFGSQTKAVKNKLFFGRKKQQKFSMGQGFGSIIFDGLA
jgi:hypothetical protein